LHVGFINSGRFRCFKVGSRIAPALSEISDTLRDATADMSHVAVRYEYGSSTSRRHLLGATAGALPMRRCSAALSLPRTIWRQIEYFPIVDIPAVGDTAAAINPADLVGLGDAGSLATLLTEIQALL
jgi:hypothetical protein